MDGPYWENWGLALDVERIFHFDRVFEMHDPKVWRELGAPPPPEDLMNQIEASLFMRDEYEDFPKAVKYPMDMVREFVKCEPACSGAMMFALALTKNPLVIRCLGFDLDLPEHRYQRECMAYLKGVAVGLAVDVEGIDHLTAFRPYGTEVLGAVQ